MSFLKIALTVLGLLLSIFVGLVRYLSGPEWALSLFYLFPICIVTWLVGRWAGVLISVVSATSWLIADLMMIQTFSHFLIPYLNETFRLIVFFIITFTLSALKNLLNKQQKLALTDTLTGTGNRRAFFKLVDTEIDRSGRFNLPFSIAYIDLDNFKKINDHFGHSIGDILLRSAAKTIKSNIRTIDTIARLGGDEFVLLLPETGDEAARSVAQKLRVELLNLMNKNKWPVTASIGVVTFNCPPNNVDEVIKEADHCMYSAKHNGKNMIKYQVANNRPSINFKQS
jgi:diguanylate cyclase (GGDEF)-like protein